ncbi:hypothetical protein C2R22_03040 [Salinigranum rubrum]|uniref:Uncharacterized protein n=1 Tax=Salinigranum rubrum TaxID=755307 RepID=A0A2I8VFQ3_9EURY|nr:hypothetical protein [Salinigranum rubrum]AUV80756.1 hypothetical protein C2R22_03040 [Salinigranum rubrum]
MIIDISVADGSRGAPSTITIAVGHAGVAARGLAPSDLSIDHEHDGEWTELETRALNADVRPRSTDVVVLEADTPRFSRFAVDRRSGRQETTTGASPAGGDAADSESEEIEPDSDAATTDGATADSASETAADERAGPTKRACGRQPPPRRRLPGSASERWSAPVLVVPPRRASDAPSPATTGWRAPRLRERRAAPEPRSPAVGRSTAPGCREHAVVARASPDRSRSVRSPHDALPVRRIPASERSIRTTAPGTTRLAGTGRPLFEAGRVSSYDV